MCTYSSVLPPKIVARELGSTIFGYHRSYQKLTDEKIDRLIVFQELTDLNFDKTLTLSLGNLHYEKIIFTKGLKLLCFECLKNYFSKLVENSFK